MWVHLRTAIWASGPALSSHNQSSESELRQRLTSQSELSRLSSDMRALVCVRGLSGMCAGATLRGASDRRPVVIETGFTDSESEHSRTRHASFDLFPEPDCALRSAEARDSRHVGRDPTGRGTSHDDTRAESGER